MKFRDWHPRRTTPQLPDSDRRPNVTPGVRATGIVITSLIAIGTAIVSYTHALDVIREVGNTGFTVWIIPLFADGLITQCSVALYAAAQAGRRCLWAWAGIVIGITVTITFNVTAGWHGGYGGAGVGALTPVVLLISVAVLEWLLRLPVARPEPQLPDCPHLAFPATAADAAVADLLHRRDCLAQNVTFQDVGERWGVERRRLSELVAAVSSPAAPAPEHVAETPDRVPSMAGA